MKGQPEDHRPDSNSSCSHIISLTLAAKITEVREHSSLHREQLSRHFKEEVSSFRYRDETNPSKLHFNAVTMGIVRPCLQYQYLRLQLSDQLISTKPTTRFQRHQLVWRGRFPWLACLPLSGCLPQGCLP